VGMIIQRPRLLVDFDAVCGIFYGMDCAFQCSVRFWNLSLDIATMCITCRHYTKNLGKQIGHLVRTTSFIIGPE